MTRVCAGLGSNVEKEKNIPAGLKALTNHFSPLLISTIYESKPLGFQGDNFYNLAVSFDTTLPALEILKIFKSIEFSLGRQAVHQNTRLRTIANTLDIDLLLFGDLIQHDKTIDVPRGDIQQYSFVLCTLAEIASDFKHPEIGLNLKEIWQSFDKNQHPLKSVTL